MAPSQQRWDLQVSWFWEASRSSLSSDIFFTPLDSSVQLEGKQRALVLFDVLGACAYLLTVTNTDDDMDQMERMTVATRYRGVLLGVG